MALPEVRQKISKRTRTAMAPAHVRQKISERTKEALGTLPELVRLRDAWRLARPSVHVRLCGTGPAVQRCGTNMTAARKMARALSTFRQQDVLFWRYTGTGASRTLFSAGGHAWVQGADLVGFELKVTG
jgi:hypothetical protein